MIKEIAQTAAWLAEMVQRYDYADLNVQFRVHDGQVVYIERGIVEKLKPTAERGGRTSEKM